MNRGLSWRLVLGVAGLSCCVFLIGSSFHIEDGRENESMSISNQKALLRDFAEKNGLLDYEFYVDEKATLML